MSEETMQITINGETHEVETVHLDGYLPCIDLDDGTEWYIAPSNEVAGEAVSRYYQDMVRSDPKEFACLIGEERLVQWAMDQSDEFGICSLSDFYERVSDVPEEQFASYDGTEWDDIVLNGALMDALDLEDADPAEIVAYRHN